MKIEKRYGKKSSSFVVLDDSGNPLAFFPKLAQAALVLRFLRGECASLSEAQHALAAIIEYDEQ